jgi:hypothetical protein
VIQEPFLPPQTTSITAEGSVGTNDSVTWNDNANHVRAVRTANRSARIFIAEAFRHP